MAFIKAHATITITEQKVLPLFLFGKSLKSWWFFSVLAFLLSLNLLRIMHMDEHHCEQSNTLVLLIKHLNNVFLKYSILTLQREARMRLCLFQFIMPKSSSLRELKVRPALVSFICLLTMASWEEQLCLSSFTNHFLQTPNSFTTFNDHQLLAHFAYQATLSHKAD